MRLLRASSSVVFCGLGLLVAGCVEAFPDRAPLSRAAGDVEIVSDRPNAEVYEPCGEVSATIIAKEVGEAFRQAANELRNKGAEKGATFVSIDDVTSRSAWDLSGRTVVTMAGTAFRPRP